jgi:uncharacterized membrane protein YccF (DUF307 family)
MDVVGLDAYFGHHLGTWWWANASVVRDAALCISVTSIRFAIGHLKTIES